MLFQMTSRKIAIAPENLEISKFFLNFKKSYVVKLLHLCGITYNLQNQDTPNRFGAISFAFKEASLLTILTRNICSNSCQYGSTIPGKNCMLPTFQKRTFCKGLYGENGGPSI